MQKGGASRVRCKQVGDVRKGSCQSAAGARRQELRIGVKCGLAEL